MAMRRVLRYQSVARMIRRRLSDVWAQAGRRQAVVNAALTTRIVRVFHFSGLH